MNLVVILLLGASPRQMGNRWVADTAMVKDTSHCGRGAMSGFGALLSEKASYSWSEFE